MISKQFRQKCELCLANHESRRGGDAVASGHFIIFGIWLMQLVCASWPQVAPLPPSVPRALPEHTLAPKVPVMVLFHSMTNGFKLNPGRLCMCCC
jgi:hypothetical protein